MKLPYGSIPKLIKEKHFHPEHPENHNIKITNKKLPYASIWCKNKWEIRNKKDIIEDLVEKSYNMIDSEYDNDNTHLDNRKKDNYTIFRSKFDNNDKPLHKQLEKDTGLLLINESKHLDNFALT